MKNETDYKKFVAIRKAIQNPLRYDLYYDGVKLTRVRSNSIGFIAGVWGVEAWFPGETTPRIIEVEKITFKRWNATAR